MLQSRVADLITAGSRQFPKVAPDGTVYEAIEAMAEAGDGAALVVREGRVAGILTERDYLREVALKGRTSRNTRVAEIMSQPVIAVEPERTIGECLALMTAHSCRHLPVVRGDEVLGMVAMRDLMARLAEDQAAHIEQLARYIGGGDYPG
jgi:CBS domain-containing protein